MHTFPIKGENKAWLVGCRVITSWQCRLGASRQKVYKSLDVQHVGHQCCALALWIGVTQSTAEQFNLGWGRETVVVQLGKLFASLFLDCGIRLEVTALAADLFVQGVLRW